MDDFRRYNAAYILWPCLRRSVDHTSVSKRLNVSSWFAEIRYLKNKGTSAWNLSQTLNLVHFYDAFSPRHTDCRKCCQLRSIVQVNHTERPHIFTTRSPWRRALRGSSATAELFTLWHYASTVYAMARCLSVCLSVTSLWFLGDRL